MLAVLHVPTLRQAKAPSPECCGSCRFLNLDDGVSCGFFIDSRHQMYHTNIFAVCDEYGRDPNEYDRVSE